MLYHTTQRHIRRLRAIKRRLANGPLPYFLRLRYESELSLISICVMLDEQRKHRMQVMAALNRICDKLEQIPA